MDNLAAHARALAGHIDRVNHLIGHGAMWLSIAMVLVQFIVVVMRYAFGIGSILMQEAIVYMHAVLFMMAAADTCWQKRMCAWTYFMRVCPPHAKPWWICLAMRCLCCRFACCCFLCRLTMCDCPGRCWRAPRNQRHSSSVSSEKRDFGFRCPTGIASRVGHDQSRPPPARPRSGAS